MIHGLRVFMKTVSSHDILDQFSLCLEFWMASFILGSTKGDSSGFCLVVSL